MIPEWGDTRNGRTDPGSVAPRSNVTLVACEGSSIGCRSLRWYFVTKYPRLKTPHARLHHRDVEADLVARLLSRFSHKRLSIRRQGGTSTCCWEGPVPHMQLITAGSTTMAASHASKSIVKQAVQCSHHPTALDDSRAQRRTRRDGPTNKQQQRAHRHGEIPRAAELGAKRAWGGKCTRTRRGDMYAHGTRQELVLPALRHCATRSDMAQHHGRPMGAYPSANRIQSVRVGSVSREGEKKGRSRAEI